MKTLAAIALVAATLSPIKTHAQIQPTTVDRFLQLAEQDGEIDILNPQDARALVAAHPELLDGRDLPVGGAVLVLMPDGRTGVAVIVGRWVYDPRSYPSEARRELLLARGRPI